MKHTSKIIIVALALILTLSVCGCTRVNSIARDIQRAGEFVISLVELSKLGPEGALAEGSGFLHAKSGLNEETIREQIKENEAIKGLNLEGTAESVIVGAWSTPTYVEYNEELGGNIYEVSAVVTVDGHPLNVSIQILSDESAMGVYSFTITER